METDAPAILIVDDNEDNRYTLQLLLEAEGYSRSHDCLGWARGIGIARARKIQLGPARYDDAGPQWR